MSDLIPQKHIQFNKYWRGWAGKPNVRPEDPGAYPFSRVRNARAKLGRFDRRLQPDVLHGDPRMPTRKPWGPFGVVEPKDHLVRIEAIEGHMQMLKERLARHMRLQLIHVAGPVATKQAGINFTVIGQRCLECDGGIIMANRFQSVVGPDLADDLFDDEGFWKVGTRVLERQEGPYMSNHAWLVLAPDEVPPSGFIPCKAAFDAL